MKPAWISRLLWLLTALCMALGSTVAYGGPLLGPGAYLLWLASFYNLLVFSAGLSFARHARSAWLGYLVGVAGSQLLGSPPRYVQLLAGGVPKCTGSFASATQLGRRGGSGYCQPMLSRGSGNVAELHEPPSIDGGGQCAARTVAAGLRR